MSMLSGSGGRQTQWVQVPDPLDFIEEVGGSGWSDYSLPSVIGGFHSVITTTSTCLSEAVSYDEETLTCF